MLNLLFTFVFKQALISILDALRIRLSQSSLTVNSYRPVSSVKADANIVFEAFDGETITLTKSTPLLSEVLIRPVTAVCAIAAIATMEQMIDEMSLIIIFFAKYFGKVKQETRLRYQTSLINAVMQRSVCVFIAYTAG